MTDLNVSYSSCWGYSLINTLNRVWKWIGSGGKPINCFEKESVSTPQQRVQRSGKDYPVLQLGGRAWPPFLFYRHRAWQWNLALARVLAALTAHKRASTTNSNSGACYASVLSRPAALPGVSVLSESELAKLQQVLRDACAVAVIAEW